MRTALLLAAGLAAAVSAAPAVAQTAGTDVPDRFRLEVGGFNMAADTNLRVGSPNLGGTDIDFETDLDLPDGQQRGYIEGYWRAGRRHLLSLSFARLHREGPGTTLDRDIAWDGLVFPVGLSVVGRIESDYFSGAYRFAAYRNERFEIGPAIGFGLLTITAGLSATGTVTGPGGETASGSIDRERSRSQPTGNLGAYLYFWPGSRVLVRGDFRYIIVKPENAEASLTDARAGLTWYVWRGVGLGAQYTYNTFRYEREILASDLSGDYRYSGIQGLVSFAF